MSNQKKKFKKKTINGIKYVQSNEDMQWYPRYLDDWKVLNRMDRAHKLKIQSTDPSDFKTYKDKSNRRSRYMNIPNLRRANAPIRFGASLDVIKAEYKSVVMTSYTLLRIIVRLFISTWVTLKWCLDHIRKKCLRLPTAVVLVFSYCLDSWVKRRSWVYS